MRKVYILNAKGEKELFSKAKVYRSLIKTGVKANIAKVICKEIEKVVYSGMKTSEIFKKVRQLLKRYSPQTALKYNLREGMRKLGPTGFPFEKYVGRILESLGFKVKLNQRLDGKCFKGYEIDFIAQNKYFYIGECKYHQFIGKRVHLPTILAFKAKFTDLKKKDLKNKRAIPILVTNTKFSNNSIKFSKCAGIKLLGWKYPEKQGLEDLIAQKNLYPVTVLSIKKDLLDILVSEKLMLAQDLLKIDSFKFCKKYKIKIERFNRIIKQARILLYGKT